MSDVPYVGGSSVVRSDVAGFSVRRNVLQRIGSRAANVSIVGNRFHGLLCPFFRCEVGAALSADRVGDRRRKQRKDYDLYNEIEGNHTHNEFGRNIGVAHLSAAVDEPYHSENERGIGDDSQRCRNKIRGCQASLFGTRGERAPVADCGNRRRQPRPDAEHDERHAYARQNGYERILEHRRGESACVDGVRHKAGRKPHKQPRRRGSEQILSERDDQHGQNGKGKHSRPEIERQETEHDDEREHNRKQGYSARFSGIGTFSHSGYYITPRGFAQIPPA